MRIFLLLASISLLAIACNKREKLPVLGNKSISTHVVNGQEITDSIDFTVPDFSLMNQDSQPVTKATMKDKIYVADFFFSTCPTICPVMKKEMIRVYEKFKGNPSVMILSHTIDPEHDTLALLRDYAKRLGADGKQWMFLNGKREDIYTLAEQGYYSSAQADSTEPGGFIHSGGFILVDRKQRIRGIYDGTNAADVDRLMEDMDLLLEEKE